MKFLENFMRYNIYMYYFNAQVDTSLNYNIIKMTFVITIVIIIFISNFIFYKNKKMKILSCRGYMGEFDILKIKNAVLYLKFN